MGLSVSYEPTEWEEGGGGGERQERENGGWRMELKEFKVSILAPDIRRCLTLCLESPLFSSIITPHTNTLSNASALGLVCRAVCDRDVFIQRFIVMISLNKSTPGTLLIRFVPESFLYFKHTAFEFWTNCEFSPYMAVVSPL